ncbi:hypothetical protein V8F33_013527 [Rhypophila sp. PSN 637]
MHLSFCPGRPQLAGEQNQAKQPSNDNTDGVSLEAAVFTIQSSVPAIEKDKSIDLFPATSSKRPVFQELWSTFSIISSLSQLKKLGKHHRHCGPEKKETDDANVPRYSDDFSCDAKMENDWLVVSDINPDFKDEYNLQQATPADKGALLEQDLLYQAALAATVQKAADAGKFDRNTSPKVPAMSLPKQMLVPSPTIRTDSMFKSLGYKPIELKDSRHARKARKA